ncbi:lysophospholipid acyltransferase family protein [Pontiellaceae bacterium B12219]|nr:lysophospholipid acyltransferase family protein [Pontiellaceae bacterium B12219]
MYKILLTILVKTLSSLPLPMVRGVGRLVGFIFGNVVRHHRADAFQALEQSLPGLSPRECKRIINTMYLWQGVNFMEGMWYTFRGLDRVREVVEFENEEYVEQALAKGKGILALTAHFGNFEIMPMATVALGHKMSVIVKPIRNKAVEEVYNKYRACEGVTYLPRDNSYRDCLKALRRQEVVGMIIDQNMTRDSGIFVDYFGRPACTSPGLAYMAAQSKAPVVPVFVYRKKNGHFVLKLQPPLDPPEDRKPETILKATQLYTKIIEDAVRNDPEQWIWMHRRWKTTQLEGQSGVVRAK